MKTHKTRNAGDEPFDAFLDEFVAGTPTFAASAQEPRRNAHWLLAMFLVAGIVWGAMGLLFILAAGGDRGSHTPTAPTETGALLLLFLPISGVLAFIAAITCLVNPRRAEPWTVLLFNAPGAIWLIYQLWKN